MITYYVSFVIRDDAGYTARYNALVEAMKALCPARYWAETTSYILFETDIGADAVVAHIKAAIDERVDIALLGSPGYKTLRVIGASKDADIYKLVDFAKKD